MAIPMYIETVPNPTRRPPFPARRLARGGKSQETHPRQPLQVAQGEDRGAAPAAWGRAAGRAWRRFRHRACPLKCRRAMSCSITASTFTGWIRPDPHRRRPRHGAGTDHCLQFDRRIVPPTRSRIFSGLLWSRCLATGVREFSASSWHSGLPPRMTQHRPIAMAGVLLDIHG